VTRVLPIFAALSAMVLPVSAASARRPDPAPGARHPAVIIPGTYRCWAWTVDGRVDWRAEWCRYLPRRPASPAPHRPAARGNPLTITFAPSKRPRLTPVQRAEVAALLASGDREQFTVVNDAGVPPAELWQAEWAVQLQSAEAALWWKTPVASFGQDGWAVTLEPGAPEQCAGGDIGCHGADSSLWAAVEVGAPGVPWTETFSHEVLETLADPIPALGTPWPREICDPVDVRYLSHGVWLQDFVLPAAFATPLRGRLDFLRDLTPNGTDLINEPTEQTDGFPLPRVGR
jgi:hypothetical protein